MYIGHGRLRVCVCPSPHSHTCMDPDVSWENGCPLPCSCALFGGFAIGAWVLLLRQHTAECEMSASA